MPPLINPYAKKKTKTTANSNTNASLKNAVAPPKKVASTPVVRPKDPTRVDGPLKQTLPPLKQTVQPLQKKPLQKMVVTPATGHKKASAVSSSVASNSGSAMSLKQKLKKQIQQLKRQKIQQQQLKQLQAQQRQREKLEQKEKLEREKREKLQREKLEQQQAQQKETQAQQQEKLDLQQPQPRAQQKQCVITGEDDTVKKRKVAEASVSTTNNSNVSSTNVAAKKLKGANHVPRVAVASETPHVPSMPPPSVNQTPSTTCTLPSETSTPAIPNPKPVEPSVPAPVMVAAEATAPSTTPNPSTLPPTEKPNDEQPSFPTSQPLPVTPHVPPPTNAMFPWMTPQAHGYPYANAYPSHFMHVPQQHQHYQPHQQTPQLPCYPMYAGWNPALPHNHFYHHQASLPPAYYGHQWTYPQSYLTPASPNDTSSPPQVPAAANVSLDSNRGQTPATANTPNQPHTNSEPRKINITANATNQRDKGATKSEASNRLSQHPLQHPSPWAHEYQSQTRVVQLIRRGPKETSWGMSIQISLTSVLVERPEEVKAKIEVEKDPKGNGKTEPMTDKENQPNVESLPSSAGAEPSPIVATDSATDTTTKPKAPRQRRRKRIFFSALVVTEAQAQNKRHPDSILESGDMILSIAGTSTAGLDFASCCALFRQIQPDVIDGTCSVKVEIARRVPKPTVAPLPKVDLSSLLTTTNPNPMTPLQIPVTLSHLIQLAQIMLDHMLDCRSEGRVLGISTLQNDNILTTKLQSKLPVGISFTELWDKWAQQCHAQAQQAKQIADQHWQTEWEKQSQATVRQSRPLPLTDVRRSVLRAAPRPAHGCKCGSPTHVYVNHPDCPLYSNLSALVGDFDPNDNQTNASKKMAFKRKQLREEHQLNSVEMAKLDRFQRQQAEKLASAEEARFVARMEKYQLEVEKKAILAPSSLTVMILSAVMDLEEDQHMVQKLMVSQSTGNDNLATENVKEEETNDEDDSDSDDDDDMPLSALVNPKSPTKTATSQKNNAQTLNRQYMLELAKHVSKTWGHVARELSHGDYAWRWEVFRGQHGTTQASSDAHRKAKNPRGSGSRRWENVQCMSCFTDQSQPNEPHSAATLNDLCLAHILDPVQGTGLMDEVLALVRSGVLEISASGCLIVPKKDAWFFNVDVLLLETMNEENWADPRYRLNATLIQTLQREWVKVEEDGGQAWASRYEPNKPIYYLDDFDVWRDDFEKKQETRSNEIYGINEFGV